MKKIITAFLFVALLISSCARQPETKKEGAETETEREILITSGGETISPFIQRFSDYDNGLYADYYREPLSEFAGKLHEVQYSDDFSIEYSETPKREARFTIYNGKYERQTNNIENLSDFEDEGEFYVHAEVGWGNEKKSSTIWYFFKVKFE